MAHKRIMVVEYDADQCDLFDWLQNELDNNGTVATLREWEGDMETLMARWNSQAKREG
jgi:hypothetical protein